jgi:hypothetical protein
MAFQETKVEVAILWLVFHSWKELTCRGVTQRSIEEGLWSMGGAGICSLWGYSSSETPLPSISLDLHPQRLNFHAKPGRLLLVSQSKKASQQGTFRWRRIIPWCWASIRGSQDSSFNRQSVHIIALQAPFNMGELTPCCLNGKKRFSSSDAWLVQSFPESRNRLD